MLKLCTQQTCIPKKPVLKDVLIPLFFLLLCVNMLACNTAKDEKSLSANNQIQQFTPTPTDSAEFHYQQGLDFLKQEYLFKAKDEFQTVIDKYPQDPIAKKANKLLLKINKELQHELRQQNANLKEIEIEKGSDVSIEDLLVEPSKFDGKRVRVRGYMGTNFTEDSWCFFESKPGEIIKINYRNIPDDQKRLLWSGHVMTVKGIWNGYNQSIDGENVMDDSIK